MVTKPTGGQRGRPSKHPIRVKGPRGRPQGAASLRKDPERYTVAYVIARWALTPPTERLTVARAIAQMDACDIGSPEEAAAFADALAQGRRVRLKAKASARAALASDATATGRSRVKDWANKRGERLWRKAQAIEERLLRDAKDGDDAASDAGWLFRMVTAWLALLGFPQLAEPVAFARGQAAEAGETDYFDAVMMQYVQAAVGASARIFAI